MLRAHVVQWFNNNTCMGRGVRSVFRRNIDDVLNAAAPLSGCLIDNRLYRLL